MKDEFTPEVKRALDKLGMKFLLKCIWNGFHHSLMLIVMNVIIILGVATFADGNEILQQTFGVLAAIFVLSRIGSTFLADLKVFNAAAKKLIEK